MASDGSSSADDFIDRLDHMPPDDERAEFYGMSSEDLRLVSELQELPNTESGHNTLGLSHHDTMDDDSEITDNDEAPDEANHTDNNDDDVLSTTEVPVISDEQPLPDLTVEGGNESSSEDEAAQLPRAPPAFGKPNPDERDAKAKTATPVTVGTTPPVADAPSSETVANFRQEVGGNYEVPVEAGDMEEDTTDRPIVEAAPDDTPSESYIEAPESTNATQMALADHTETGDEERMPVPLPDPQVLDASFFLRKKEETAAQPKKRMTEAEKLRQLALKQRLQEELHRRALEKEKRAAATAPPPETPLKHARDDSTTNRASPADNGGYQQVSTEDYSWMDEVEETDDESAEREFREVKKAYKAKKKAGKVNVSDEIDFLKAKHREERRLEKYRRHALAESDSDSEVDDSLIPEDPAARAVFQEAQRGLERAKDNARNARQAQRALEMQQNATKKRARGGLKKATQPPGKSALKPGVKKTTKANKKAKQVDNVNFATLFSRDTLAAANLNRDKGTQPGFTETRKDKALAQLIASIPEEDRKGGRSDRDELLKATKVFHGQRSVKSDGRGGWLLTGMLSSLQHHQLLGTAWMRQRENQIQEPRGGIQADEMGYGKTIMALANIMDGQRKDPTAGATLVVAPAGLLIQWAREIRKHVRQDKFKNILTIKKRDRALIINPQVDLGSRDIVLTSYHELMDSYPKYNPPITLVDEQQKLRWWEEHLEACKGPIFRLDWNRVIFDECQALKNYESRTAKAAIALSAKYRWCLSGTPLINGVEEFYSYFNVLQMKTGDMQLFKRNYKKTNNGYSRLNVVLQTVMMRRTYETELFGKPVVTLPENAKIILACRFTPLERKMYDIVEKRFVERIRALARSGPNHTSYSVIFNMLLRLRQLASHMFLIQETIEDLLEEDDIKDLMSVVKEELDKPGAQMSIKRALRELRDVMVKKVEGEKDSEGFQMLQTNDYTPRPSKETTPIHYGVEFDNAAARLKKHLADLAREKNFDEIEDRSLCCGCGCPPIDPWLTSCSHVYCRECLTDLGIDEQGSNVNEQQCRTCGDLFTQSGPCSSIPELERLSHSMSPGSNWGKSNKKNWFAENGHLFPSAKFLAVKMQIITWLEQAPEDKIIVFSQFTKVLHYLARMCDEQDWHSLQYHGGMNLNQRDAALQKFQLEPHIKILLTSLKAGGTGLNLVMANKIINMEPWWNLAIESQAYCRVFRLGQNKKTEVVRFVVEDTIDDKLLAMQRRKCKEINGVMDPGKKLSRAEMLQLFDRDENGDPYVWPDGKSFRTPPPPSRGKKRRRAANDNDESSSDS